MKETIKISNKGKVKLVAHRGLSGVLTENTVGAFALAANKNYYGIETDLHLTLDGRFILYHDDSTKRLSNKDLILEETNYAELKAIKLTPKEASEGEIYMPDLSEYINICKNSGKAAVLEIKNAMSKEALLRLCKEIKALGYFKNTIFISFHFSNLRLIRKIEKTAKIQFLINRNVPLIWALLKIYKMDVDIYYPLLTKKQVRNFHKRGIKVNCWTCDDPHKAQELIAWGVDYITTNILE